MGGDFTGNIIDSTFSGNSAGMGGAVASGTFTGNIISSTFSGNSVGAGGGAVYANRFTGDITASTFTGNSTGTGGYGGAVNTRHFTGDIIGSTFSNNSAGVWGGAVFVIDNFVGNIIASTFSGNSVVEDGGAVATRGAVNNGAGNPAVSSDSLFQNNHAGGRGGAMYFELGGVGAVDLALSSTANGLTLFSGNSDRNGPNSLFFDEAFNQINNQHSARLTVSGQGSVGLLDPIGINTHTTQTFTFVRDNSLGTGGEFLWGGRNVVWKASSTSFNFDAGRSDLRADFSLEGASGNPSSLNLAFRAGHLLGLDLAGRNPNQAFFGSGTFDIAGKNLTVEPGSQIVAPRSLLPADNTYLLFSTLTNGAAQASNFVVQSDATFTGFVWADGANNVWLTATYNPYLNAGPTTLAAAPALQQWLWNSPGGLSMSTAAFNKVMDNPDELVPDSLASAGNVTFNVANAAAAAGLQAAFLSAPNTQSNTASLAYNAALTPPDMRGGSHQGSWKGFSDQDRVRARIALSAWTIPWAAWLMPSHARVCWPGGPRRTAACANSSLPPTQHGQTRQRMPAACPPLLCRASAFGVQASAVFPIKAAITATTAMTVLPSVLCWA